MELELIQTPREAQLLLEQRDALVDEAYLQLDARNIEEARRLMGRAQRLDLAVETLLGPRGD